MATSRLICCLLLTALAVAQDPALPGGTVEIAGRWRTGTGLEPFWARLLPPDPAFGGHRLLQVVYTPPPPPSLGGSHLVDCPFLLLDDAGRLIAWNERTGQGEIQRRGGAYHVIRDRTPDDQAAIRTDERDLAGPLAWELTAAPLLVALAWASDSRATVPAFDAHGDRPAAAVAWNRAEVSLAGRACRAEADAQGRLQRLVALPGEELLIIDRRTDATTP